MGTLPAPLPLSRVLFDLSNRPGERITLDEIAAALSDRSYGALLLLFAIPNLLPLPLGSSTLFAPPLILVASQLLLGRPRVWLPRLLRERSVSLASLRDAAERTAPLLRRIEKLARPRSWPRPGALGERAVGALVLVMSVTLMFPIPLGNWLPAISVVVASLALTERDGIWLSAAFAIAVAAIVVIAGVLGTIGVAARAIM